MKDLSIKISSLLIKYRLVITFIIPVMFLTIFGTYFLLPKRGGVLDRTIPQNQVITPYQVLNRNPKNNNDINVKERDDEILLKRPGLGKKEVLKNGLIKYSFPSINKDRPNIIIQGTEKGVIFQRSLTLPDHSVTIANYTKSYGFPKFIFKGSKFYGVDYQTYIYPELGIAFIGNPKTGQVLEQHLFLPTKVEDYVNKYGDDIPAQP